MGNIKRELVAASSKMIILSILMMEDNYGYNILELIKTFTKGFWEWKEGMLYPMLHKMEKDKLILSYWKETTSGKKRKYYHITQIGINAIKTKKKKWAYVNQTLSEI